MQELKEVESRLKSLSKKHPPGQWKPESYIGGNQSQFKFLNLRVPHIRKDRAMGYSFSNRTFIDQWEIWNYIWKNTHYFEVALSSAQFINSQPIEDVSKVWKKLLTWQKRVDNWALSDELSHLFSKLLEYKKNDLLPHFDKWNVSTNPWEVRQSMVGLIFYSRFRRQVLPCSKILSLVEPNLLHEHYYVQKAVGWTLRECWSVYPKKTFQFMKKNAQIIPVGGWQAATEKLPAKKKVELKKERLLKKALCT